MEKICNKWNAADCQPNLTISDDDDAFQVSHFGDSGWSLVRAMQPIHPESELLQAKHIACYYEVKIEKNNCHYNIRIGFCDQHFSLENDRFGGRNTNSIEVFCDGTICRDGTVVCFKNGPITAVWPKEGDVIGCGLLAAKSPDGCTFHCFSTHNGKLIGMVDLPARFFVSCLFPVVALNSPGDSIRANFGNEPFQFELEQLLKMKF